jgi:hypothetical protein
MSMTLVCRVEPLLRDALASFAYSVGTHAPSPFTEIRYLRISHPASFPFRAKWPSLRRNCSAYPVYPLALAGTKHNAPCLMWTSFPRGPAVCRARCSPLCALPLGRVRHPDRALPQSLQPEFAIQLGERGTFFFLIHPFFFFGDSPNNVRAARLHDLFKKAHIAIFAKWVRT